MTRKKPNMQNPESGADTSVAMDAIQDGVSDATEAAAEAHSAIGEFVSNVVYKTFYTASFGVVFTGLMIGKILPKCAPVASGLHDGAVAARHAIEDKKLVEESQDEAVVVSEITDDTALSPA